MITILGPTACGKTTFAAHLAHSLGAAEIISADSRQVYRGMDIGTGKDLADYTVAGNAIPYHLIDIANPGERYNVYRFQHDFLAAYKAVIQRGAVPILCGGTGLYIESILRRYRMSEVPENPELRASLADKELAELTQILAGYVRLHNSTDVDTAQRSIRAIEIAEYYRQHPEESDNGSLPDANDRALLQHIQQHNIVIGLSISRELRRERISQRLHSRLDEGMLDEIRRLLAAGTTPDELIYYGLEYKYLTLHVIGQLSYTEMIRQLEIAIHQFAKRQMTWFRGMERRGIDIHWIDAACPMPEKLAQARQLLQPQHMNA
jgi:tRNA dimethylallyltransferase